MGGKWSLGRGSKYIAMSAALGTAPHYLLLEAQSHGGVPSSWHRWAMWVLLPLPALTGLGTGQGH